MPFVRTGINIQPRPGAPSPVWFTRSAPGVVPFFRMGEEPHTTSRVWGRFPVEAVEGHEPDPHYDVRISGLYGAPRRLFGPTAVMSSAHRPRPSQSRGLGQAPERDAELARLYAALDEIALAVQDGMKVWSDLGDEGQMRLGEHFAGTWAYALEQLTSGNRQPARNLLAGLAAVKRWRDDGYRRAAARGVRDARSSTRSGGFVEGIRDWLKGAFPGFILGGPSGAAIGGALTTPAGRRFISGTAEAARAGVTSGVSAGIGTATWLVPAAVLVGAVLLLRR